MNGSDLLDAMEYVDGELVENADAPPEGGLRRRLAWYAVAACLVLVMLSGGWRAIFDPEPIQNPAENWEVYYNPAERYTGPLREYLEFYTYDEDLTEKELAQYLPDTMADWMAFSGITRFYGNGELRGIYLTVDGAQDGLEFQVSILNQQYSYGEYGMNGAPDEDGNIVVYFDDGEYVVPLEAVPSTIGDRSFKVYEEHTSGSGYTKVWTEYFVGDMTYRISANLDDAQIDYGKDCFKALLACYGVTDTVPKPERIQPSNTLAYEKLHAEIYYNRVSSPIGEDPTKNLTKSELASEKIELIYSDEFTPLTMLTGYALYQPSDGAPYGVQLRAETKYWDKPVMVLMRKTPEDVFLGATPTTNKLVRSTYVFVMDRNSVTAYRADTDDGIQLWMEHERDGIFYRFYTTVENGDKLERAKNAMEAVAKEFAFTKQEVNLDAVWEAHYNNARKVLAPGQPGGYFEYTITLKQDDLKKLMPEVTAPWMDFSGCVKYNSDGQLNYADLLVNSSRQETGIQVQILEHSSFQMGDAPDHRGEVEAIFSDGEIYMVPADAVATGIGTQNVTLYKMVDRDTNTTRLWTEFRKDGLTYLISAQIPNRQLTAGQEDFWDVLTCYVKSDKPMAQSLSRMGDWFDLDALRENIYYNHTWASLWVGEPPYIFEEDLTGREIGDIIPEVIPETMTVSGQAVYYAANGGVYGIRLSITDPAWDGTVSVLMSRMQEEVYTGYVPSAEVFVETVYRTWPDNTRLGGYRYDYDSSSRYWVEFQRQDMYYRVSITEDRDSSDIAQALRVLDDVTMKLLTGGNTAPDLNGLSPKTDYAYIHQSLTLEEARQNQPFGPWVLRESPEGTETTNLRYDKDAGQDRLSSRFTTADGFLDWEVTWLEDADRRRIVSVEERENDDLSLYPPRLSDAWYDAVPEETREMLENPIFPIEELTLEAICARVDTAEVNDGDSPVLLGFGVLCGDVLIQVSAKNIDPQWLYDQLMALQ